MGKFWLNVVYRDGTQDHPAIGTSFAGKRIWRMELHISLADLYSEACQKWLTEEVVPRLYLGGPKSIRIEVIS